MQSLAHDPLAHYRLVTSRQARVGHRAARWAGTTVDAWVGRALRGLFLRGGTPYAGLSELERGLEMIRPFTDPQVLADPDRLLAPTTIPALRLRSRKKVRGGQAIHAIFDTPYRPVHPLFEAQWSRYDNVGTAHVHAWRHDRPAPLSIILVHGWGVGDKRLHAREFDIAYFFRRLGIDVYFYVMPYHGARKPSGAKFSGELFPSGNLLHTNEGFVQVAQELRALITMIKQRNPVPLGMMGSSLGGYTTALLASIDERLDFAVPVLAMGSLAALFWDQGDDLPLRASVESLGMTRERFCQAWALHSPLSYRPKTPPGGRLIVSATGDILVPPQHTEPLWEHWDRPPHVRFAGGHILQVYRRHYHRRVAQHLAIAGLLDRERLLKTHPNWTL